MTTAALAQASLGEREELVKENNAVLPAGNHPAMEEPVGGANLKRMFTDGIASIGTQKHLDLFKDLETRQLTQEEENIIEQRVALQRKLLEAYERQEHVRKVAELREVCPQLTEEAASKALQLCDGREDDAAAELVSNPTFVSKVMSMCQQPALASRPGAPPADAAKLARTLPADFDTVFVGAFRGKGYSNAGAPKCTLASLKLPLAALALGRNPGVDGAPQEQLAPELSEAQGGLESPEAGADVQRECRSIESDSRVDAVAVDDAANSSAIPEHTSTTPGGGGRLEPSTRYGLAVESNGKLRPARDSEVKRATACAGRIPDDGPQAELRSRGPTSSGEQGARTLSQETASDDGETRATDSSPAPREATASPQVSSVLRPRRPRAAKAAALAVMLAEAFFSDDEEESKTDDDDDDSAESPLQGLALQGHAKRKRAGSDGEAGNNAAAVISPTSAVRPKKLACEDAEQWSASSRDERAGDSVVTGEASQAEGSTEGRRAPGCRVTRSSTTATCGDNDGSESGDREASEGADSDVTVTDDECQPVVSNQAVRRSQRQRAAAAGAGEGGPGQRGQTSDAAGERSASIGAATTSVVSWRPRSSATLSSSVQAVSASGHTNRGRVKQKSHKSAELVDAGQLWPHRGWCNAGYIFPLGFASRTLFRSSVALDQLCVHDCYIQGSGGAFWPAPTFTVIARDRPDEPLVAKSCTGCWTAVLKRINAEIEARRAAGEALPPPPKTAIAGPEYFGLNQVNIQEAIEQLDPGHLCLEYWAGKAQRERAAAGLPLQPAQPASRAQRPAAGGGRKTRRRVTVDDEDEPGDAEELYASKWSGINRTERYRKRREEAGEDPALVDEDNPVPDIIDPITLEPVIRPAISPYGHVMGLATWKAVLAERKTCPFTKQPLSWEACRVLTKNNYHLYSDRIIR